CHSGLLFSYSVSLFPWYTTTLSRHRPASQRIPGLFSRIQSPVSGTNLRTAFAPDTHGHGRIFRRLFARRQAASCTRRTGEPTSPVTPSTSHDRLADRLAGTASRAPRHPRDSPSLLPLAQHHSRTPVNPWQPNLNAPHHATAPPFIIVYEPCV